MSFFRSVGLTLATWFAASAVFAQVDLTPAERIQFADGLFSRAMYELAAKEYEAYLRDLPEAPDADAARFRLGECRRLTGNRDDAVEQFRRAFAEYPRSEYRFKAGFKAAVLLRESGKDAEAAELLARILKEGPPPDIAVASRYELGDVFLALGKTAEAAKAFEDLLERDKTSDFVPYTALKLGQLVGSRAVQPTKAGKEPRVNRTELERAIGYYNEAVTRAKTERLKAEALFQSAELYFRAGQYRPAFDHYRRLAQEYPSDQRTAEATLQYAWSAYQAGFPADALALAAGVLTDGKAGKAEADWLYLKANAERELGRNAEAVATYSRLLAEHSQHRLAKAAQYEKVLALYRMGAFKPAVDEARRVTPEPEIKADLYRVLGESYTALQDYDNAIQYYKLLVREFPKSELACEANFRLGYCFQKREELLEAARCYALVAAECPQSELAPQALFASAVCLSKAGRLEEAVRDWSDLIKQHDSHPLVEEALFQNSLTQIRLKRDREALETLRTLLGKFPNSRFAAEAWYWQGTLLREAGRLEEAQQSLRQALTLNPREEIRHEAQYNLAIALQKLNKHAEATELFQTLLGSPLKERFSPQLLEWLATQQLELGHFDRAVEAAALLVERTKDASWQQIGYCLLGRGYKGRGQKSQAIEAFTKAVEAKALTPSAPEAALHLGEVLLEANRAAEAEAAYRKAATLAASDEFLAIRARAYAGLGRSVRAQNRLEEAARFFMSVAVLYDEESLVPECLYEASRAFSELGNTLQARKAAEELKQRYPQSEWTKKLDPGANRSQK
ncbi:MAG: tetratricopeptide repeat protein [Kiritimatiellia bacterium]